MNDRFKFRVWDNEQKRFTSVKPIVLCVDGKAREIAMQDNDDGQYMIEQCTGLRDKNGRLIYEGDVVFCESGKAKGVIKFEKGSFVFEWKFAKPLAFLVLKYTDDVEIVGNIHEVEQ